MKGGWGPGRGDSICWFTPEMSQAKARSLGLYPRGTCGCQGPQHLSQHLRFPGCAARSCIKSRAARPGMLAPQAAANTPCHSVHPLSQRTGTSSGSSRLKLRAGLGRGPVSGADWCAGDWTAADKPGGQGSESRAFPEGAAQWTLQPSATQARLALGESLPTHWGCSVELWSRKGEVLRLGCPWGGARAPGDPLP